MTYLDDIRAKLKREIPFCQGTIQYIKHVPMGHWFYANWMADFQRYHTARKIPWHERINQAIGQQWNEGFRFFPPRCGRSTNPKKIEKRLK